MAATPFIPSEKIEPMSPTEHAVLLIAWAMVGKFRFDVKTIKRAVKVAAQCLETSTTAEGFRSAMERQATAIHNESEDSLSDHLD